MWKIMLQTVFDFLEKLANIELLKKCCIKFEKSMYVHLFVLTQ